jgi:tetratricopeptide (TPR) repeat protein
MFKNKILSAAAGGLSMIVVIYLLTLIPAVQSRLSWRLDEASTYMRGVINPISKMPTPRPVTEAPLTTTPTPPRETATPAGRTTQASPTPLPPTATPTQLPSSVSLPAPAYEKQGMNNCGPTALSTYLRYYNWKGDQYSIADILKSKPEDRNVNVEELVYYVRNYAGWLNVEYRVGGDINLLKTYLANGIPIVIEESMKIDQSYWPNDDLWAGHYLFINGYNDATQTFVSQDTYYGPNLAVSYDQLEKNWQGFNHVYIVMYLPEQEETVKAIMGDNWDKDTNRKNALADAEAATKTEPKNAFHWFNLGTNLVYFDRYSEASVAYDQARQIGIPQRMLRYQFGPFMAYFNALRTDDLITISKYAIQITPNSEEAHLWYGWGLFRSGDRQAALSEFNKSLSLNQNYADAQYALTYLANN